MIAEINFVAERFETLTSVIFNCNKFKCCCSPSR